MTMYRSQTLALRYFAAAITFFGVMTITGLPRERGSASRLDL
jgi:hypothetical protein